MDKTKIHIMLEILTKSLEYNLPYPCPSSNHGVPSKKIDSADAPLNKVKYHK